MLAIFIKYLTSNDDVDIHVIFVRNFGNMMTVYLGIYELYVCVLYSKCSLHSSCISITHVNCTIQYIFYLKEIYFMLILLFNFFFSLFCLLFILFNVLQLSNMIFSVVRMHFKSLTNNKAL